MGDDDGNPQFISPEYEDITVTVYGVDDSGENALDDDFCFMVTSSRLKQEWDTFFTNGEECVLYYQDYYYKSAQRNPVYAVVVYRDRMNLIILGQGIFHTEKKTVVGFMTQA